MDRTRMDRARTRDLTWGDPAGRAMQPRVTVAGRDVLFAHWPVDPTSLDGRIPDALAPATFDDDAWVSVVTLEADPFSLGADTLATPHLNLRTYVTLDGDPACTSCRSTANAAASRSPDGGRSASRFTTRGCG